MAVASTGPAAIAGWTEVAGGLYTAAERRSVVTGLETVCVELAARFATDVFDDRYFGWDPVRFRSRRAHNLVRARGQLALAAAVGAVRAEALALVAVTRASPPRPAQLSAASSNGTRAT